MAYIYRLILFLFLVFSGSAFALVPQKIEYSIAGYTDKFPSKSAACIAFESKLSPGLTLGSIEPKCTYNKDGSLWNILDYSTWSSCPPNSTASGSECSCNAGATEKDGQCEVPLTDLQRCKDLNTWYDSTFNPTNYRDVPGRFPFGITEVCVPPGQEGMAPFDDPNKGCAFNYNKEMSWQHEDGSWGSGGKMTTKDEAEVCTIGDGPPSEPDPCPAGFEKNANSNACEPIAEDDTECPPGYYKSEFAKGMCVHDGQPDPFDPKDPTDPTDPKDPTDPTNPNPDPDPTNPNPTPPGPGPGNPCPEGRTKNAEGMCEKNPPGPGDPCPEGYEKDGGQCVPKRGEPCPEGQEKEDGQCVPKGCTPEPAWPEKCLPCQKDALNPKVCKEDPGKCEPDPAIPDKCGKDDEDKGKFGGSCAAGFTCEGDVIQCAIAREQHIKNCKLFEDKSPESELYNAEKGKEGNVVKDLEGNETINVSGRIDTSDALGGGGGGVSDLNLTVAGHSVTLPLSVLNDPLRALGSILVAISFLIALRIVGRG